MRVTNINSEKDLAYVIYTSGSTGIPKGTMIEHKSLINRLSWMQKSYSISEDDIILQKTPYTFDVSLWELFWWSFTGASVKMIKNGDEKDPNEIVNLIYENSVTTIHFVPSMLNVFLDYIENDIELCRKVSSLKRVFASGEALKTNSVIKFKKLLYDSNNIELINLYGPTEATVDVSYFDCFEDNELKSVPIGKPIDNIKLYVLDRNLQLQPVGVPGELCISGIGLSRGYLNREDLTESKFIENPFIKGEKIYKTGDLARWQQDGNIEYLGRIDFQVKIRGLRIELGEVESALLSIDEINEAVVIANEDLSGDKSLYSFFTSNKKLSIDKLKNVLENTLLKYMIPSYFYQIDEIPLTSNGKVNRKKLIEISKNIEKNDEHIEASTEVQLKLTEIWKSILYVDKIGINNNFFNSGGDSIKAIRLVSKINKEFESSLKINDLYSNNTIIKLEKRIISGENYEEEQNEHLINSKLEAIKSEVISLLGNDEDIEDIYPMSDIEKGMVFYYLKDDNRLVYFEQFAFEAKYNDFNETIFRKALEMIMEKHPILRTSFNIDQYKEPVQIVWKNCEVDYQHLNVLNNQDIKKNEYIYDYLEKQKKEVFNFETDKKLWKMRTFKFDDEYIYITLTCHHAILDGWSVNMLVGELHTTYLELLNNIDYKLKKNSITYKETIIDEIIENNKPENIEFWRNELKGFKKNEISVKLNRKKVDIPKKITNVFTLDNSFYSALKEVAIKYDTTVKSLCFVSYAYALGLICNSDEVIVGYLTNNRPVHEDGDKIMGCFLNTIPVRLLLPYGENCIEYVKKVDRKLLEVKKHERMSLFEISKAIEVKNSNINPIFDSLYNYMDFSMIKDMDKDDVINNYSPVEGHQDTNTLFDFMIDVTKGNMIITIRYSNTIISEGVEEKVFSYFKNALNIFINNPEKAIVKSNLICEDERNRLLKEFNDTEDFYNKNLTMVDLFKTQVEKTPDKVAVSTDLVKISYKKLDEKSNKIAKSLMGNGVRNGEKVAIIIDRSIEMIEGVLGILKAGGVYIPIEPYMPEKRIDIILSSLNIKHIISNVKQATRIMDVYNEEKNIYCLDDSVDVVIGNDKTKIISEMEISLSSGSGFDTIRNPEDNAYIIFTSGSTGTPKGVIVKHKSVINLVEWMNKKFDINSNDKVLAVASIGFDLSVYDIFGIFAAGGEMRLASQEEINEPEKILNIITEENISIWNSAPPVLQRLMPFINSMGKNKGMSFRYAFLSGDWIPVTMPRELMDTFKNLNVVSLGGATEATVWSNYYEIEKDYEDCISIPYGKPIQNAKYYILDERLQLLPIGTIGDLYIGGECLAEGYVNDKVLTDSKFIDNPYFAGEKIYKTGDLARWCDDSNMELIGRSDYQVKIRGYRIELGEIEVQLTKHDEIKQAIVLAKGEKNNKHICAYIVASDDIDIDGKLKKH